MDAKNFTNKVKQAWKENPVGIISVGALVASSAAGLTNAVTNVSKSRTWKKEVKRRINMNK